MFTHSFHEWARGADAQSVALASSLAHLVYGYTDSPILMLNHGVVEMKSRRAKSIREIEETWAKLEDAAILRSIERVGDQGFLVRYGTVPRLRIFLRSPEVQ